MERPELRTIYFGAPKDFYSHEKFEVFVKNQVSAKLKELGSESPMNKERISPTNITYHFPNAELGINYELRTHKRCEVKLIGTQRNLMTLRDITQFFFEEDNK